MPALAVKPSPSFKRGVRPDTGASVRLSPNCSPPKISTDCVRACSCATVRGLSSVSAASTDRTELTAAYFIFANGRIQQPCTRERQDWIFDSDMMSPAFRVNSWLRLEKHD